MKKWVVTIAVVVVLAVLALTVRAWLPPLLTFAGANSDTIQGLTGIIQIVLWGVEGIAIVIGLWLVRKERLQAARKVARNITVGRDVKDSTFFTGDGNVFVLTNGAAEAFFSRYAYPRLSEDALRGATRSYLEHVVDRYRYLDMKGMGVADRVPLRLPLLDMYVPLKARIEMPGGETWSREMRLAGRKASEAEIEVMGSRLSEPTPVLELLQEHDGLVILGDPGSGKTTFLKYLALNLAIGEGDALGVGPRLPVLLPLSAYANTLAEKDVPLCDFISEYYHNRDIDLPVEVLQEALERGGVLFLLDGLDEVKEMTRRHLVVERVVDFYTSCRRKGNKFVLTSRIVGYREVRPTAEGLAECTLVDFEENDIEDFVDKWTAAIERAARGDTRAAEYEAAHERGELLEAVRRSPGVRQLASNPLLLTILALMKRQGVTLPERRVELYEQCVKTLLKNWNLARGLDHRVARDLDVVETVRVLAPLALWMHEASPGVGLVKREDVRRKLVEIYSSRGIPKPEAAAQRLLEDAREYAGLLLERGAGEYGFIHLTFQEYLAGVAIAQLGQSELEPVVKMLAEHVDDDNWHEVSLLAAGYMGIVQQRDEAAGEVLAKLMEQAPGEPGAAAVLAGEAVADAWPGGVTYACRDKVVEASLRAIKDDAGVKAVLRAAAGRNLAKLGDPRFRADAYNLPDEPLLGFLEVPAGKFTMGSVDEDVRELVEWLGGLKIEDERVREAWKVAYESEAPQHETDLPGYYISRYPVTNAQFRAFVDAGGYREPCYWKEAEEAGVWQDGLVKGYQDEKPRGAPRDYGVPYSLPNHPVVGVTWYEALAYTRWLTDTLREWKHTPGPLRGLLVDKGWVVTLPSEAEWEKAARGTDGRKFPWGDEADPNCANYRDTGIGMTSAVGCFPGGSGECGAEDMSGNVWEWTRSLWGESWREAGFRYPYNPDDGREDLGAGRGVGRVLRGGAFPYNVVSVRCARRYWVSPPYLLINDFGVRVVVVPPFFAPSNFGAFGR